MPDILLIQPPVQDFYLTAKRTMPYGLACIAAELEKQGFSADIFDALAVARSKQARRPAEMAGLSEFYGKPDISPFALFHAYKHFGYSFDHIGEAARRSGAFLVGISSLFTPYSDMALKTAEVVRQRRPACKIVLGGHHPTAFPEQVLNCPAVDFVIRGEGEIALPQLAEAVRRGRSEDDNLLRGIPGIAFRGPDGALYCPPPAVVDRLDDRPLPAIDKIDRAFYSRKKKPCAVITASRGCPLKCSYCVMGTDDIPYRKRSVASVLAEIDLAVSRHGARFIDFEDENLTMDRDWFMELLDGLRALFRKAGADGDMELRAMNGLYPPSLDEPMIAAMKAAGFTALNLSVGTFDPEQQRRFHRPDVGAAHDRAVRLCEKHGLAAVSYIIAGAPDQAPDTTLRDLGRLLHQKTIAGLSVFYPAPGSRDFDRAADLGLLPGHFSLMRSSALPLSQATTRKESVTLLRLSRVINFIKFLRQNSIPIPSPRPFVDEGMLSGDGESTDRKGPDRTAIGRRLLGWFLHDAIIRGVTPDDDVYEHIIAPELTRRFIDAYL